MLDFISRGAIVVLSALSVAGAIKLAPGAAQSSFADAARKPLPAVVRSADVPIPPVAVRRDPFTEPAPPTAPTTITPARTSSSANTIEPLPSNLPNDTIPTLPGAPPDQATTAIGPRVTAIVTGPHPYAMLDTGGVHDIKGLGDRVGGVTIVAIDLDGVRLSNGLRLAVDPAARP